MLVLFTFLPRTDLIFGGTTSIIRKNACTRPLCPPEFCLVPFGYFKWFRLYFLGVPADLTGVPDFCGVPAEFRRKIHPRRVMTHDRDEDGNHVSLTQVCYETLNDPERTKGSKSYSGRSNNRKSTRGGTLHERKELQVEKELSLYVKDSKKEKMV